MHLINIGGCVSNLLLLLFEDNQTFTKPFFNFKKDIESIDSMYKYLIKESPIKERTDLIFLGELSYGGNFIGKMGHLVNFLMFFE